MATDHPLLGVEAVQEALELLPDKLKFARLTGLFQKEKRFPFEHTATRPHTGKRNLLFEEIHFP